MKALTTVAALTSLFLAGCARQSDLDALRAELRENRFEYSAPKIEVVILQREVLPPRSEYSGPAVRITGVIRQVGDFPLKQFRVGAELKVKHQGGAEASVYVSGPVRDGNFAFTADATLYEAAKKPLPRASEIQVELESVQWGRESNWRNWATLTVQ